MNWEALGAIGEILGSLVVVVSLIYVARQIRQNTEQSKLASSHAVDTSNMLAFDPIYLAENSKIWTEGHANPDSLDQHERHIFNMLMARILTTSFNTTSYHHARGMLEDELYKPNVEYFGAMVSSPGGRAWYSTHKHLLHPEAREALENVMAREQQTGANGSAHELPPNKAMERTR